MLKKVRNLELSHYLVFIKKKNYMKKYFFLIIKVKGKWINEFLKIKCRLGHNFWQICVQIEFGRSSRDWLTTIRCQVEIRSEESHYTNIFARSLPLYIYCDFKIISLVTLYPRFDYLHVLISNLCNGYVKIWSLGPKIIINKFWFYSLTVSLINLFEVDLFETK